MPKFAPGKSGSEGTRFQPGQSGNPLGKSARRIEFEHALADALANEGTPAELGKLVWEAARRGEAWAVQMLFARLAPQTQSLRLVHERGDDGIDYRKLSNEQIDQLRAILERAASGTGDALRIEGGEGAPQLP